MKKLSFLILFFGLLIGCNKQESVGPKSGIYRGVFYRLDNGKDTIYQGVANLAISEVNNTYTLVPDKSDSAPLTCYGRYILHSADSIQFINDAGLSEFFYDELLVLDTMMRYSQNGENLLIEFTRDDTIFYEYVLKQK